MLVLTPVQRTGSLGAVAAASALSPPSVLMVAANAAKRKTLPLTTMLVLVGVTAKQVLRSSARQFSATTNSATTAPAAASFRMVERTRRRRCHVRSTLSNKEAC